MNDFTLVAETDKYTVVGSYEPEKKNSLLYESEAALEKRFIAILEGQGYEYLSIKTTGTDIDLILPPMSRFGGGNREEKKQSVIAKLQILFERYKGLSEGVMT